MAFSLILDFVHHANTRIAVQVQRKDGEMRCGYFDPVTDRLTPIEDLGPFVSPNDALRATKRWVTAWAQRNLGDPP